MFPAEAFEAGRANLFLSFEDELDVMSQQVVLYQIFKSLYLNERLSFVIVRTARPDVSVAYFGLEGIAFPEFQRFGGHYVVVGFGFGTDAGDTDKAEQLFQHSGFVLCDIFLYFHNNNVK